MPGEERCNGLDDHLTNSIERMSLNDALRRAQGCSASLIAQWELGALSGRELRLDVVVYNTTGAETTRELSPYFTTGSSCA
jgi:hypothetical protein